MKPAIIILCGAAFALTGCTTISSMFAENPKERSPVELAESYVPLASPVPSDFCARFGVRVRQDALMAGFDAATQDRMAQVNSRQCQRFATSQVASL